MWFRICTSITYSCPQLLLLWHFTEHSVVVFPYIFHFLQCPILAFSTLSPYFPVFLVRAPVTSVNSMTNLTMTILASSVSSDNSQTQNLNYSSSGDVYLARWNVYFASHTKHTLAIICHFPLSWCNLLTIDVFCLLDNECHNTRHISYQVTSIFVHWIFSYCTVWVPNFNVLSWHWTTSSSAMAERPLDLDPRF